ncbi:MAG: polysaccharide biosynthesis protein [Candidatus Hodarchaeales archaeon]|jgi:FlaA1/EpsC-like NDP-sugar epimerase
MNKNFFKNKIILVTGAAGSIGRELVKQLLELNPIAVRALDTNETGLFYLDKMIESERLRTFIGDIRDPKRLNLALENTDIVFHAAALKHVPLCEYNPFEAIKTNIIGTQNLIQAARSNNVKKLITISTDKAINPTNVMGATKLLADRLTIAANLYLGDRDISFSTVRFGNVLGSRGSIIPLFFKQIRKGESVSVTDPNMTRYIMKIEDAVKLVIKVATFAKGGEIFILEMPAIHLGDLVDVLIEEVAPLFDHSLSDIKVKIIGNRIGEKAYEELLSDYETKVSTIYKKENIFILVPNNPFYHPDLVEKLLTFYNQFGTKLEVNNNSSLYSSSKAKILTKSQIKPLVRDIISEFLINQLDFE